MFPRLSAGRDGRRARPQAARRDRLGPLARASGYTRDTTGKRPGQAIAAETGRGPPAVRNRLTKGGIPDTRPNLVRDLTPRRLGDHSCLASIRRVRQPPADRQVSAAATSVEMSSRPTRLILQEASQHQDFRCFRFDGGVAVAVFPVVHVAGAVYEVTGTGVTS